MFKTDAFSSCVNNCAALWAGKGEVELFFGALLKDVTVLGQDIRIDFQFDRAAFTFKLLPFKIPYPVPFKLLGDETKV